MPRPTRGPWQIVHNWRGRLIIVGPRHDGQRTDSDRICNLPHRRDGAGLANARLIANAPALLDIALEYRDLCRKHGLDDTEAALDVVINRAIVLDPARDEESA